MFIRWKQEILLWDFIKYINLLLEKDQINTYKELGEHSVDELSGARINHGVESSSVKELRFLFQFDDFWKN